MDNPYGKNRLVVPAFIFIVIIWAVLVFARSTGITGRTQLGGSPGCTCHNPNADASVTVTISGPETLEVSETAGYTVTITGGPLSAAGTNIATDNGTLATVDGSLKLDSNELTHTSPKTPSGNAVTFAFEYTAPDAAGEAIIAATGNSVNLSGDNTGDSWNFAENFGITIGTSTAITDKYNMLPNEFKLDQNYPNPFNPSTTINYQISKLSKVNLTIYDILGQKVQTAVDAFQTPGSYKVIFNTNDFKSGSYFYVLTVDGKSQSRRMTLIK